MSESIQYTTETADSLNKLAAEVLKQYGITPEAISIIQSGSIKTVWKVKTHRGIICLKRLKQTYDKILFSVNAQIHIKNAEGNVPAVIPGKTGDFIVQYNDQLFAVYEWLKGRDLDFGHTGDLAAAMEGLAHFHMASRGYEPSQHARISSKVGRWPEQYQSMKNRMAAWKEISAGNTAKPYYSTYLKYADAMLELCDEALKILQGSQYENLASSTAVLCHQDFGRGNALLTDNGVYVLDLDSVTFDLPARDLRKIIGKNAETKGQWDGKAIQDILNWYTRINPLSDREKEVLYIDMLFPHWFFGLVKNLFQNGKALKPSEIERIARLELSKKNLLKTLIAKRI